MTLTKKKTTRSGELRANHKDNVPPTLNPRFTLLIKGFLRQSPLDGTEHLQNLDKVNQH